MGRSDSTDAAAHSYEMLRLDALPHHRSRPEPIVMEGHVRR